ncbi:hypothetical protein FACS189472_08510 [Alphaproteobacteria bacterium]|nr:hypothetical protein FACS189472_08510 [Alphaproteobacteria bacterium]
MGRKLKYATKEEALDVQKKQIRQHEEKYKQKHREYRENVSNIQRQIVILLSKNVIEDTEYLKNILNELRIKINPKPTEEIYEDVMENVIENVVEDLIEEDNKTD